MQHQDGPRVIAQIQQILDSGGSIGGARIREWMGSPSAEVRWAALDLLLDRADRVDGLSDRERNAFVLDHLDREIRAHHEDPRLPGPYVSGHSLRAWFERLWSAAPRNDELLAELRQRLADLSTTGGRQARDVVITAVLEHVFHRPDIVAFFSVWRDDPQLAPVYEEAMLLARA